MSVQCNEEYDRERLALYLTGLLPDDADEGQRVLSLCAKLVPVLAASREENPVQREREAG
jgi:hypothetical protein